MSDKILIWLKAITNIKLSKNITFILIAIIIASAYIIVENNKIGYKEKIRIENELQVEKQRDELNICLDDANTDYHTNWDEECKSQGLKKDCRLPEYNSKQIEKWRIESEKQCMDKFKSKAFSVE